MFIVDKYFLYSSTIPTVDTHYLKKDVKNNLRVYI